MTPEQIKEIDGKRIVKLYDIEDDYEDFILTDMTDSEIEAAYMDDELSDEDMGLYERIEEHAKRLSKSWGFVKVSPICVG